MKSLSRLAVATDFVAFAVVLMGSWTRINAAGLTCPDWPMCRGELIPSMGGGTLWEWLHRLLAFSLAPLIVAVCLVAWRYRRESSLLLPTSIVLAALFLIQVGLGVATVRLDNTPFSVVLHWGTAMGLVATLTALAIFARVGGAAPASASTQDGVAPLLAMTAVVAFLTMCIGAYVSSSGAGLACLSIPGCAGSVVVYTPGQFVQMLHRIAAAATLISAAAASAVALTRSPIPQVRVAAGIGALLVFMQVLLGLLNVALRLPIDLRELHAGNAALVFLAFVAASAFAFLESSPRTARSESRR